VRVLAHVTSPSTLDRLRPSASTMSIKAKDLQYDRQEPAFLRRLKAGITGVGDDPDRQINPLPLPKKPKRLEKDEDDGPTYVVEDSNETLTKEEYEELMKGGKVDGSDEKQGKPEETDGTEDVAKKDDSNRPKQRSVRAGAVSKKRKAVKVVGEDEAGEAEESSEAATSKKVAAVKGKKKAKVKLSFDDEEER